MVFLNSSDIIGTIIIHLNENVSGSMFMTGLLIVMLLLSMAMAFRIPLEFSLVLVLPILLALMTYSGDFRGVGGVILIYLAVIFAKTWFIR